MSRWSPSRGKGSTAKQYASPEHRAAAISEQNRKRAAAELRAFIDREGISVDELGVILGIGQARAYAILSSGTPTEAERQRIAALLAGGAERH